MKRLTNLHIDRTFWVLYLVLVALAVITLFSASSTLVYATKGSVLGPIGGQMLFIALGIAVAFGIQLLPTYVVRFGGYLLLGVSVLCLYSLLIPGNPLAFTANGATRWMRIGSITFQPSELAKLGLIIVVSDLLSRAKTPETKRKYFWWTLCITGITVLPILVHNLSTTILVCGIVFLLWVLANIPWKYTLSTVGIAIIALVAGYTLVEFAYVRQDRTPKLFDRSVTWVKRIDKKLFPDEADTKTTKYTVTDENRQEVYANVAIARGGASPIGVLPGNSKERDYLPLAFMDYIFAIFVEEWGIIGAIGLIILYLWILFRACYVSTRFGDTASMLMVMGLALMITTQALMSMLVAVGIMPVTGQPLPMISKGGTSVLITSVYFGIMMCVSREQSILRERQDSTTRASEEDVPEIIG
ncbi:MAG: FtsW/RodA/SpoVE family cell cycle protein [Paludibacteraceae bacterium]